MTIAGAFWLGVVAMWIGACIWGSNSPHHPRNQIRGAIHPLIIKYGPLDTNDSASITAFVERIIESVGSPCERCQNCGCHLNDGDEDEQ